jgi:hypothetical protein
MCVTETRAYPCRRLIYMPQTDLHSVGGEGPRCYLLITYCSSARRRSGQSIDWDRLDLGSDPADELMHGAYVAAHPCHPAEREPRTRSPKLSRSSPPTKAATSPAVNSSWTVVWVRFKERPVTLKTGRQDGRRLLSRRRVCRIKLRLLFASIWTNL